MKRQNDMLQSYINFMACELNTPISVIIELSTQCNVRCKHCYLPEHGNKGLSTETVKKLLHDLRELGVFVVSFTGGEIFLRDDIFELIEEARKLHMRVFLLSNATLLDEEKVKKLKSLHISQLSATVFSTREEVHDSITGVKGSLKRVLENIKLLSESNIKVMVKMPIMKDNASSYDELSSYCERNNYEFYASTNIFQKNDGDSSPTNLRLTGKSLCDIQRKIDLSGMSVEYGTINNNQIRKNKYDAPCIAIFGSFSIDSNGDVYPCNAFLYKVGNIYENSVREIWYESKELKYIKSIKNSDLTQCVSCKYVDGCHRCPGMALADHNDMFSCDTFARILAEVRANNYELE